MQKSKLLMCIMLVAAIFCSGTAQGAGAGTPKKGVIRVKLQPEMALKVGHAPDAVERSSDYGYHTF